MYLTIKQFAERFNLSASTVASDISATQENSRPSSELGGLYDSLLMILLSGKMHIVKTNLKVI